MRDQALTTVLTTTPPDELPPRATLQVALRQVSHTILLAGQIWHASDQAPDSSVAGCARESGPCRELRRPTSTPRPTRRSAKTAIPS